VPGGAAEMCSKDDLNMVSLSHSMPNPLLLPKSLRTLFVIPSERDRQEEKKDQIRRKKTKRKMYLIPNTTKLGFAKEERTSNGLMKEEK
jgi:hypothetical protein